MSLTSLINPYSDDDSSEDLLHKWDHVLSGVTSNDIYSKELALGEADKFIFDFNGLLQSMNIPKRYWFVHCRLNNFKSSTDYDGRKIIYLLENSFLDKMYTVISNNSFID